MRRQRREHCPQSLEYLKSCKIAPSNSLLRIFKRYLRLPRARIRSHPNNSIPFAAELRGSRKLQAVNSINRDW